MTLNKVLISDPIDQRCIDILEKSGVQVTALPKCPPKDELKELIKGFSGLIVRSGTKVTREIIEAGKGSLKLIGRAGTGVDNIDVEAASDCGILVMNTPGGNTLSAAEHTCAMMTALARGIAPACASMKAGKWDRKQFMGQEMNGKILGLVGMGRVGREVAIRMQAYGMKVIGYDPFVSKESAAGSNIEKVELDELWPVADWISIHSPLLDSTRHMINSKVFSKCKKGVHVVNVARGGILDDADFLQALNDGTVGGAAIDVFENEPPKTDVELEIIKHSKVLATPHLGASTKEAQIRVAEEIADQFISFNKGQPLMGLVNGTYLAKVNSPAVSGWLSLAKKLGKLAASLSAGQGVLAKNTPIEVYIQGSDLSAHKKVLSIGAVVGAHSSDSTVNMVTAERLVAQDKVTVNEQSKSSSIQVKVNEVLVEGLVAGAEGTEYLINIGGQKLPLGVPLNQSIGITQNNKKLDTEEYGLTWIVVGKKHTLVPCENDKAKTIPSIQIIEF